MGNKHSSTPPLPSAGLSECDAYAAATARNSGLHDLVRFSSDYPREKNPTTDHQTESPWIVFDFHSASGVDRANTKQVERAAVAAREAVLAWAAVASCRGFGVDENPQFWQRVFTELRPATGTSSESRQRRYHQDMGAARFFNQAEDRCRTVRIVLKEQMEQVVLREFLDPSLSPFTVRGRRLKKTLALILPHVQLDMWRRPIRIMLNQLSWSNIESVPRLNQLQARAATKQQSAPRFRIAAVRLRWEAIIMEAHLAAMAASPDVQYCTSSVDSAMQPTTIQRLVEQFPVVNRQPKSTPPRIHIESLHLFSHFPEWCSALPSIGSIQRLKIAYRYGQAHPHLSRHDAAWLGYALFRPGGSGLPDVELGLNQLDHETVEVLKVMATGNNLLWAMGLSDTITTGYSQARLRAGTRICSRHEHKSDDTDVVAVHQADEWVSLCESSLVSEWIRVVAPGRGIGYVKSADIVEEITLFPEGSRARRLRVLQPLGLSRGPRWRFSRHHLLERPDRQLVDDANTLLLGLLSVVGNRLSYLDLEFGVSLASSSIHSILGRCPRLKTLLVGHDGSYWSDSQRESNALEGSPQLEQLELRLETNLNEEHRWESLHALSSSQLNSLRVLRVVHTSYGMFESSRQPFLDVLARYPQLRSATWATSRTQTLGIEETNRTDDDRRASFERLGVITRGVHDVTVVPLNQRSRWAFLSCIHRGSCSDATASSPLSRIGPDVARIIFAFCSSLTTRHLHVDKDKEYPPPNRMVRG